jgi:hypothetical protein
MSEQSDAEQIAGLDHCTACHASFAEARVIMHANGDDECPVCHARGACVSDQSGECPECGGDYGYAKSGEEI